MEPVTGSTSSEGDNEIEIVSERPSTTGSGAKRGRKEADIKRHFSAVQGSYVKSCKRWAQQCNSCGLVIAAGSSTLPTLTRHVLHNCKEADPAAQLHVINQEAAKVATDSSGSGASKGVQRDIRTQLGGSKLVKLSASEQQTAAEHFMRFLITSNAPFQAMGNTHLIQGMQVLRPGYEPPSPTTFKTVLLLREYALCISKLHQLLKSTLPTLTRQCRSPRGLCRHRQSTSLQPSLPNTVNSGCSSMRSGSRCSWLQQQGQQHEKQGSSSSTRSSCGCRHTMQLTGMQLVGKKGGLLVQKAGLQLWWYALRTCRSDGCTLGTGAIDCFSAVHRKRTDHQHALHAV